MKSVPVTIGVVVSLMSAPPVVGMSTLERRHPRGLIGGVLRPAEWG
jgi:AcrR family transcriptional regulator